ncbi:MAG: hypothetical protein U1U88_002149 [Lawsonella clevelandensis]
MEGLGDEYKRCEEYDVDEGYVLCEEPTAVSQPTVIPRIRATPTMPAPFTTENVLPRNIPTARGRSEISGTLIA